MKFALVVLLTILSGSAFATGSTELTCESLICRYNQEKNGNRILRLHEQNLWQDLQDEIKKTNYKIDINYYLLGRAAEGLGDLTGARQYYIKAIAEKNREIWYGLDAPLAAVNGLERIGALAK